MTASGIPTITYALPTGSGKSGMGMQIMQELLLQGKKILFVSCESHIPVPAERQAPAPHNPGHTALERICEGIRRVCQRTQGVYAPAGSGLAQAGLLLEQMGERAKLLCVRVRDCQVLPGQGRKHAHRQATRLTYQTAYLLHTRWGYFDDTGRHAPGLDQALRQLGLAPAWHRETVLPHRQAEGLAGRLLSGASWSGQLQALHLHDELHDEIALALLEAGTHDAAGAAPARRL